MRLALGIAAIWFGASCLYLASHGLEATTPWGAYQTIMSRLRDDQGD
jgi:hypothetical protein